jgi:hypothetical protein
MRARLPPVVLTVTHKFFIYNKHMHEMDVPAKCNASKTQAIQQRQKARAYNQRQPTCYRAMIYFIIIFYHDHASYVTDAAFSHRHMTTVFAFTAPFCAFSAVCCVRCLRVLECSPAPMVFNDICFPERRDQCGPGRI